VVFPRDFPSLNALVVLEAAVRHRGFTAAAAELGVTQAAVSRQIAQLEADLGVSLFERRHRAVEPSPACVLLASSLARSFAGLVESVEAVRATAAPETVTIGATLAVSSLWLLPRIVEFRRQFPAVSIRVVSQDARINLQLGEVDVIVRFGSPPFDDGAVLASRGDEVLPVCAPAYLTQRQEAARRLDWKALDLIGQDVPDRRWLTWADWFSLAGVPGVHAQPALRFNQYAEALQAARAGHGVVLGWRLLVNDDLERGLLVPVGSTTVTPEGRYNLVVPLRRQPHATRDLVIDWLAGQLSR
jgi:LysR family transcriptional regulator, glycine cleavage system transcriptional activator